MRFTGALVLSGLLTASGFVSSDLDHPVAQSQRALTTVQWGAPMIAVAVLALSIVATTRYDLTSATVRAEQSAGRPRRSTQS